MRLLAETRFVGMATHIVIASESETDHEIHMHAPLRESAAPNPTAGLVVSQSVIRQLPADAADGPYPPPAAVAAA